MKPELIYGLDEAAYHADTTSLSASSAKVLLGKRPPAPSDALRFGTLVHTVILEPERLGRYEVLDAHAIAGTNPKTGKPYDSPTMTSKYKAAVAEAAEQGLTVVSQDDWDAAHAEARAVMAHPEAARLLAAASEVEVSAYADHPTGARVRARFDLLGPGFIADIKTTRDANPDDFGRTVHSLGYHISAANYLDIANANGLEVDDFALICVEKDPTPGGDYRVAVMDLTERAIQWGRELMYEACERWLALGGRVDLPSYGEGRHTIDLPPWAYPRDDRPAEISADFSWSLNDYA